jgi:hypothetical protein
MSESAKNQMNARSKVKSLAKAKVEPCDDASVDFSPFPQSMAKGCPKMVVYSVETLVNRITVACGLLLVYPHFWLQRSSKYFPNRLLIFSQKLAHHCVNFVHRTYGLSFK